MIEVAEKTVQNFASGVALNKLYCENCLDTMARMPDGFIDLTVTSPPYDDLRDYEGYDFDFEAIASELFRVTKSGGIVVWVVGDQTKNGSETLSSFRQAIYFNSMGFNVHDTMIYHSEGLTLNHNRYEQEFEYMFILSKGRPNTFNPIKIPCKWFGIDSDRTGQKVGEHNEKMKKLRSGNDRNNIKPNKIKGNIWKYNTGWGHTSSDKITFDHPAPFPEQLAGDHIRSWSNEGDVVYDPMAGSGTTLKMAIKLNRAWIGSELSSKYCDIIEKRLEPVLNQTTLF